MLRFPVPAHWTDKPLRTVFKRIFAPKEKFAPTEKFAPWQHWVSAQFKPTRCVGASWRLREF
jgi:hypothetical protein